MSNFRFESFGRTHRPKAPNNRDKNFVTGAASLASLRELSENQFTSQSFGIYRNENQRYLHIATSGSATVTNLYVYNFAVGWWSELQLHDFTNSPPSGSCKVGYNQSRVVEIYGSDWVALKVSGTGSEGRVAIAFSSF